MLVSNSFKSTIALIFIISFILTHQSEIPRMLQDFEESIFILNLVSSIDNNSCSGNIENEHFRILQSSNTVNSKGLVTNTIAIPDSSKKWVSKLSYAERLEYENMINLKSSFQLSLKFLPTSFNPENNDYETKVKYLVLIFTAIGAVFLVLILIFLILRFWCKKCVGPIKNSQITKGYRNFTWILMIGSLSSLIFVYFFLITYSLKINGTVNQSLQRIVENNNNITSIYLPMMSNLTDNLQINGYNESSTFKDLSQKLVNYTTISNERLNSSQQMESNRNLISILIFIFYLFIFCLSFFAFFKRKPALLLVLSIILLFSIPLLLFYQGIMASFYFFYSDICEVIHDSIYENKFPINNVGLGFYVSCFGKETKSAMYSYAYRVDSDYNDITRRLTLAGAPDYNSQSLIDLQTQIKSVKQGPLANLIGCSHVYDSVTFFEQTFCSNGMKWANFLVTTYTWLVLIVLICAYAVNRMKPVVEKKRNEFEVK